MLRRSEHRGDEGFAADSASLITPGTPRTMSVDDARTNAVHRMFDSSFRKARERVRPTTPCLAAEYGIWKVGDEAASEAV
jgi:hypothetical protein